MRTLLIDNYDSFTWNLAHYIGEVNGVEPVVVKNDSFTWHELQRMGPFDAIVLSPGPGTVLRAGDFGVSRRVIEEAAVPVLGVCLGHQGMAHVHGGEIRHAPEPVHGRVSSLLHDGDELFQGIPSPLRVVRYHSLVAARPLPPALREIARTECGLVMALRHRTRPQWGVQFHPESVLTEHGHRLMANFRDIAHRHRGRRQVAVPRSQAPAQRVAQVQTLTTRLEAEDLFHGLYRDSPQAFWLDSARALPGLSRFSFLGECGRGGSLVHRLEADPAQRHRQGEEFIRALELAVEQRTEGGESLPFEFRGGWVGYFGYEMKALFGAEAAHASPYPDAAWMHAERFIAVDHQEGRAWAVAVLPQGESAQPWFDELQRRIAALRPAPSPAPHRGGPQAAAPQLEQERGDYMAAIEACRAAIRDGECYQVCLTNRLETSAQGVDGLSLYRVLRRESPAPFAAYLRFDDLEVLSASPERFLQVDRQRRIETKPIKGTCRRDASVALDQALAEELQQSEKNRAENLMIVDLMRNDLSRVAEGGSVQVPRLMYIESYAHVHQLLSTIQARLREDSSLLDLLRATFPGGSITGAPKLRAMEMIDGLERSARGVYCGSIGYIGYDRVMDLNIAIRTLVHWQGRLILGAGGGITQLSDAADEFDEVMLKAHGLLAAIARYFDGARDSRHDTQGEPDVRCWLNGRLLPLSEARVPVEDRGFLYGETLFETLRVHRGQPLQLDEHLQRLQRGAEQLGFKLPIAAAELAQAARDLPALQPLDEGVLRITLSRGSAARGLLPTGLHSPQLLITVAPLPPTLAQRLRDGVRLHTSQWRRCSPQMLPGGLKIGHYLGQVLALQEAVAAGADEALMLDAHDQLCEASSANLFLVEGDQLLTPELSTGALDGVTRRLLIELAPTLGLRVVQARLERTRLAGADEVFLSSSVAGITPVAAIDGLRWSAPGPCTQALTRCYRQALSFKLEAAPC